MDVKLPNLGEGADNGVIVSILVKEGDAVEKGQTIIELESEKAVAPIPASASGKVAKIHVKMGDRISAGARILTLGDTAGATSAPAAPAPAAAPKTAKVSAPVAEQEVVADGGSDEAEIPADMPVPPASPGARKMASDLGIDLRRVPSTEASGRITMEALRAYVQRAITLSRQKKTTGSAVRGGRVADSVDFSQWGAVTKQPLTQLRKVIARRMGESWNAVPRVTQFDEADITGLLELRKRHVDSYKAKGAHLTVTCFALKAVVAALKKHPIFNASLNEAAQEIVFKNYFHIGMAVDTEQGLIVPVLRDVDKKSLLELAKELASLAERTRDRKVTADEMKGGTFTISNQGAIGGAHFTPIVNLPEVAILGLGKGALKPAVVNGKIEPRTLLPITISYDHRVIDGGVAARFTVDLVAALTNFPESEVKL